MAKSTTMGVATIRLRSVDTMRTLRISSGAYAPSHASKDSNATIAWRYYTLGRLLNFALHAYESRLMEAYHDAGFEDVRQAHLSVLRHIDIPNGSRISDIAARAGVTRSAIGALLLDCERLRLVDVRPDPSDGRARIVRYAKRGRDFMAVTRRCAKRIEADLKKMVGSDDYTALRTGLIHFRERVNAATPSAR